VARVGMVWASPERLLLTEPGGRDFAESTTAEDHELGMYHALVEARIPFDMVLLSMMDAAYLDRFKVLVLPNETEMSDAHCRALREYVARGGSLVATFETSLYDEFGARRDNFGLADVFGVTAAAGPARSNGPNSYMRIEAGTNHPLLRGMERFEQIVNAGRRVDVRPEGHAGAPPLTRIPTYPTIPMEEIYPRQARTDVPEVFLREAGKGRVVYFPGDVDRTFWNGMAVDHAMLLRNAVEWAANEPAPVTISGPGLLDIAAWRQASSMTVHMLNLTNPMMMRSAYREFIPIGAQQVRVQLPAGKTARQVKLLVNGGTPRVSQRSGFLEVTVPAIVDHEVVAIDL
jgi:hypothetical protein